MPPQFVEIVAMNHVSFVANLDYKDLIDPKATGLEGPAKNHDFSCYFLVLKIAGGGEIHTHPGGGPAQSATPTETNISAPTENKTAALERLLRRSWKKPAPVSRQPP